MQGYLLAFVIASHLTANLDSKLLETKDPADHDLQDVIDQVKLEESTYDPRNVDNLYKTQQE